MVTKPQLAKPQLGKVSEGPQYEKPIMRAAKATASSCPAPTPLVKSVHTWKGRKRLFQLIHR